MERRKKMGKKWGIKINEEMRTFFLINRIFFIRNERFMMVQGHLY